MTDSNTSHYGLLYLSPENALTLNGLLKRLVVYISRHKQSASIHYRIRRQLLNLTTTLSPLSQTKKIVNEILELSADKQNADQAKVMALIFSIQEIYPSQSGKSNPNVIHIGGC